MQVFVTSDLHLGSRHADGELFLRFLDGLPPEATLVLNGDVVDRRQRGLSAAHRAVIDRLREEALRREVTWVIGNHDERYRLDDPGRIRFETSYRVGQRLFVVHGSDFIRLLPHHKIFILVFRSLHDLRVRLGGDAVHVAYYAKRFPVLYNVFRRRVARNAVSYARQHGYAAICCGHTHYAEDTMMDGVRYLNTGAWTERPVYCLRVTDADMRLERVEPADGTAVSRKCTSTLE